MLRGSVSYMEKKPRSSSFEFKLESPGTTFQPSSAPEDWTMLDKPRLVN